MSTLADQTNRLAKLSASAHVAAPDPTVKRPRVPRAGRPATALITQQAAADAALSLIDQDGLEALNLQGVARVLGVSAPSLYHHFRDKDEILARVSRKLLEEVSAEQEAWSINWEQRMVELSLATRRVLLRHPNAASLVLRFFPRQMMLPAYENSLVDCPYPPETHAIINEVIEKFTFGSSLFAAAAKAQQVPPMPAVDTTHFPRLTRALEMAPTGEEEIYVASLLAILAGLRARYGASPKLD